MLVIVTPAGPWKIPSNKRKTKDPSAPKRPMSAFLAYSNSRRAALKREHPKSTNADLSRMLSKTWKELPPTDRAGMYAIIYRICFALQTEHE